MGSTIKLYRNSLSAVVIIVQHALCLAVTLGVGGVFALEEFLTMADKVRRASDKAHTAHGLSLTAFFFRDQTPSRSVACWSKMMTTTRISFPPCSFGEVKCGRVFANESWQNAKHVPDLASTPCQFL